jgi:hypothetical protein
MFLAEKYRGQDKRIGKGIVTIQPGAKSPIRDAQGIGAVSFFAAGKKDTSVKPGPA